MHTGTATPHIGVSGETGSGKSSILYIPLVAARMAGWLVTVIDPKQNSLVEAHGKSGVRIHTETYECCMAVAEFFVSMMAAEKYNSRRYRGYSGPDAPVGRVLVIDELPSFREFVAAWWKYIIKERGFPPVLIWIQLILMQGRSSNHRVVLGTHQFSLDVFGSTMARDQVGTKMVVGEVSAPSWAVAYGVGAPLVDYDETIQGRGVISLKGRRRKKTLADGRVERAEEIQYAYITPEVAGLLDACPPAPAWWEAGASAPWITARDIARADSAAAVADFLQGGRYAGGREDLTPDTDTDALLTQGSVPRSKPVSDVSGSVAASGSGAGTAVAADLAELADQVAAEGVEEQRYTIAQACAVGIIRKAPGAARQFKSAWIKAGKPFPEGEMIRGNACYTRAELESVFGAPEENADAA
nr:type IV secretory system conjugative DNA transfer family protein [Streptomyces sp. NBC_00974]WSX54278.1 type IV secretory system conjugative DNA transfer family protein [Streptomyces sp. NBC_00974]